MRLSLKLPWTKEKPGDAHVEPLEPAACPHPRLDVEMVGTVVKRRWCAVCGKDLTTTRN